MGGVEQDIFGNDFLTSLDLSFRRDKVFYIDQARLIQPLSFLLDQASLLFRLRQQGTGLLVGTAQAGRDLLDGEDDVHPVIFVQPPIFADSFIRSSRIR